MLSQSYQERLVTEDEVKSMKRKEGILLDRLIGLDCSRPPELVNKTATVLDKFGYTGVARKLRGW